MIFRRRITRLLLASLTIIISLSSSVNAQKSYYDELGVDPDCTLNAIKRKYRALALQYHPDRNSVEDKEEVTIKFREVSEAYEILSDEKSRSEYDHSLRYGGGGGSSGGGNNNNGGQQQRQRQARQQQHQNYHNQRQHRDPFSQFNDLFQHDPFMRDGFKHMDDLFAKKFQENKAAYGSHTSSSKSSRTIIENGQKITIISMEKDGNKIEEKFQDDKLVQRLVNGQPENHIEGDL